MGSDELELQRTVGRLEGRVMALERQNEALLEMMTEVHDAIAKAQGGWKMLVIVGSAAAAIGSFIATVLSIKARVLP